MEYFRSPKIVYGKGVLKRIGAELAGMGKKAAIITDKPLVELSKQLVEALAAAGFEVRVWDGALPEPTIEVAVAGSKFLSEFSPDLVIGFGGGSALDSAKGAWVFYERPDFATTENLDRLLNPMAKLDLRKKSKFVAFPTTAGTGSEVVWSLILTDRAKNKKLPLANNETVPDMAILVPEFTMGLPKGLTASTGLDVLSHAIDGLTARQQTDFSDGLCLQAIKMVFEWLPKAVADGADLTARIKMQNAAAIAGLGFGNSNTSLNHAVAHSLGVNFKLGHGRAVSIAMPYTLEYLTTHPALPKTAEPIDKLETAALILGIRANTKQEAVKMLIEKIRNLIREVGEPATLTAAGITKEDFDAKLAIAAKAASKDVNNTWSSPCECKEEDFMGIFLKMYAG